MLDKIFQNISWLTVGFFLVVAWLLYGYAWRREEDFKIQKFGGRAPRRRGWVPYELDLLYEVLAAAAKHQMLGFWRKQFDTYGNPSNPYTIEAGAGPRRIVLTADPENIKAVLATQFQDYGKGENFNKDWHDFLGDSIFTTDGDKWHYARQLIRPQFIKDRLSDIHVFEKHVKVLIPMLGGNGKTVDVAELFFRYTLDAATDFLLGRSVDSLIHEDARFATAFNEVQHIQGVIAKLGYWQFLMPRGKFNKELRVMNEFVNTFVDDTLRLPPEELEKTTKSDEGYTFLHALANSTRNKQVLRDQLVAVLLAGRDTTACTLSWVFYELSKAPNIVKKLRREILEQVGTERRPTYQDLKDMKYLQHVMNETLRLYPVVPFNVRLALKDTTLPHGGGPDGNQPFGVLKDNAIGYSTLAMQRRQDLYPPVSSGFPPVDEFAPERWDNWIPKSWQYIPFNGGPRICIGQQFALTEMAYTIVKVLQVYETMECRCDFPGMRTDIVLAPLKPVDIAFFKANVNA